MKKIISIFLVLSLAVCLVACGEKDLPKEEEINLADKVESGTSANKEVVKYIDEDTFDNYEQTQVIKLPENPTTGYEWVYIIDDFEVANIIKDEYQPSENIGDNVGTPGYRVCEIEGLGEGETIIHFNYIRGFEVDEEPVESFKLYVSVNTNKEIAITGEVH